MKRMISSFHPCAGANSLRGSPGPDTRTGCDGHPTGEYAKSRLGLLRRSMATNSKFTPPPMAANRVCVFSRTAAPVMSGPISGESAVLRAQASPTPAKTVEPTQETSVDVTEEQATGGDMPPGTTEEISNWWGIIKRTPSGAQYDDYFERQDLGQMIYFGINSLDPAVKSQIEAMRDSGKIVHLYGTLVSNVPDYNGSQIQVDRIVVE